MNEIDITIDPEIVLDSLDNADIVGYLGIDDVLDEIQESDAVAYYDHGLLLDEIGEDEAIKYFGIEVAE
jgi:hypothetical protein